MTVAEMRRRMSTQEFVQWVAFHNVEAAELERERKKGGRRRK